MSCKSPNKELVVVLWRPSLTGRVSLLVVLGYTVSKRPIRATRLMDLNPSRHYISMCALKPKKLTGPRAEL